MTSETFGLVLAGGLARRMGGGDKALIRIGDEKILERRLAGILAGLDWVAANWPDIGWVVSVPGDCPFLPRDLVEKLHAAREAENKPLAGADLGDWRPPVVGVLRVALREDLRHAVTVEDLRKIEVWTGRHGVALADWPAEPVDPFFNVNTPEDVERATRLAAQES